MNVSFNIGAIQHLKAQCSFVKVVSVREQQAHHLQSFVAGHSSSPEATFLPANKSEISLYNIKILLLLLFHITCNNYSFQQL